MDSQGDTRLGNEPVPPVLHCEELVFDLERRSVTLQGKRIQLSEPYLIALFLLIEKSPAAVPKSELAKAAETSEDTLYKVIETVRKALRDTEEPRKFIANERGVGYRFIGDASQTSSDAKPGGALRRRWLWLSAAFVFCLAAVLAGTVLLSRGKTPAILNLDGPVLVARDASGRELWRHFFKGGFDSKRYRPDLIADRYWTGDLDGDGNTETLFLYDAANPGLIQESSSLICFSPAGKVKWKFQVGRTVRDSGEEIHPPYAVNALHVVFSAGPHRTSRIVVASGHATDQAFQLAFLDSAGRLAAEYWHPGSLYALATIPVGPDRNPRLLAGGVNNGEHQATLVELDPFSMSGASTPSRMKDRRFRLLDMPEAHEKLVILFPRTPLSRDEPYTRVHALGVDDHGVHVTIIESFDPFSRRNVLYDFDLSLHLVRAFVSSNYREEHIKLERTGAIRGSWQDDEARLPKDLEYRQELTN